MSWNTPAQAESLLEKAAGGIGLYVNVDTPVHVL